MKVIFLDIDGVLVNSSSLLTTSDSYIPDSNCLRLLNGLIKRTDSRIVITSAWRIGRTLVELQELLSGWGVDGIVLDKTPNSPNSREEDRGFEIQLWLDDRKKSRGDVESFVILDDNNHMPKLLDFLIQTKFEPGLTEPDTQKALRILLGSVPASE